MGGTEAAGDWFAIGDLGTYCTHRTVALVRPFFGPLPLAPLSLSACLPACLRCDHRIARANSFIHSLSSIHSPTRGETALGMCWRVWSYALGPHCLTRRVTVSGGLVSIRICGSSMSDARFVSGGNKTLRWIIQLG